MATIPLQLPGKKAKRKVCPFGDFRMVEGQLLSCSIRDPKAQLGKFPCFLSLQCKTEPLCINDNKAISAIGGVYWQARLVANPDPEEALSAAVFSRRLVKMPSFEGSLGQVIILLDLE